MIDFAPTTPLPRGTGPHAKPRDSTKARPGSEAKIKVMANRVARGESCFHDDDFGVPLDAVPDNKWLFGHGVGAVVIGSDDEGVPAE